MNDFENRGIAPDLWEKYHRRHTSRSQRFREGFETFKERVENFFRWYWEYAFLMAGIGAMLWLGMKITLHPNGWYLVARSLGETFLGW